MVLDKKIYVYNFADLKLVDHIETTNNSKGICALCPSSTNTVLACPGLQRGHVRVELYDIRKTTLIPAHETDLACIALSLDGMLLATASDRGTLVRIFDTQTGQLQQELRRGADRAVVYSLAFNAAASFLACSSDKGTIHVFSIGDGKAKAGGAAAAGQTVLGAAAAAGGGAPAVGAAGGASEGEKVDDAAAKAATSNSKSNLSFSKCRHWLGRSGTMICGAQCAWVLWFFLECLARCGSLTGLRVSLPHRAAATPSLSLQ